MKSLENKNFRSELSLAGVAVPDGNVVGLHVPDDGSRKTSGNGNCVDAFLETV
jgi:hypothetical protein